MTQSNTLELDDLLRILREGAGEIASGRDDVMDVEFEALGYDSVAILETAGRIGREYGVVIDDEVLEAATTPRALLDAVNGVRR